MYIYVKRASRTKDEQLTNKQPRLTLTHTHSLTVCYGTTTEPETAAAAAHKNISDISGDMALTNSQNKIKVKKTPSSPPPNQSEKNIDNIFQLCNGLFSAAAKFQWGCEFFFIVIQEHSLI